MSADRTSPPLDFTWDPVKAASNVTKHSVTFAQAATVMLDPLALTVFDAAHSEFEERWFTLGVASAVSMAVVQTSPSPCAPCPSPQENSAPRTCTGRYSDVPGYPHRAGARGTAAASNKTLTP